MAVMRLRGYKCPVCKWNSYLLNKNHKNYFAYKRYLELLKKKENDKLRARLENAIELKAEVGDKLYMPWVYDGTYDIATLEIVNIELTDNEITYITDLASDIEGYLVKYNYGNFSNGDFDYIVFTDRDKAEAKLKELQGGNV